MGYFPFFVDISGQEGLVVGGGLVALRKVEKLLPYGLNMTVAAPDLLPQFREIPGLCLVETTFTPELLEEKRVVIAATDDTDLNREIAALCRQRGILVNVVDDPEECTFLFPALVKQGNLTVGISTGGSSPTAAVWLKEQIQDLLPENFGDILDYLGKIRPMVMDTVPAQQRGAVFAGLFAACMEKGRALDQAETRTLLEAEE